jgi:hypothetical protein
LAKAGIGPDAPRNLSRSTLTRKQYLAPSRSLLAKNSNCKLKSSVCKLKDARLTTRSTVQDPNAKNYDRSTIRSRAPLKFFKRDFSKRRLLKLALFQAVRCGVPENFAALAETWSPLAARVKKPTLPAKKMLSTDCATKKFGSRDCARRARAHLNSSACLSTRAHLFDADRE